MRWCGDGAGFVKALFDVSMMVMADVDAVGQVISVIRDRYEASGTWRISSDELIEMIGVSRADYYRTLYQTSELVVPISGVTGDFSAREPGALVTVLELFFGRVAEERISGQGIFLPHSLRVDLLDGFLARAAQTVSEHTYQEAEFADMLRAFGRYDRAMEVYLQEYFPLAPMIERAALLFVEDRSFGMPPLALTRAREILRMYFQRHVFSREAILSSVLEKLRSQAAREGYLRRKRAHREETTQGQTVARPSEGWARRTLGLETAVLTPSLLKRRYRDLMKRFHPDVNPQGLEQSKDINNAYALLLAL
jgi:hypothetical protein